MGINSRSKGARNERKIADLFSKWTGKKFAKTPASGGLQWKSSFSKGDIVCTKEGHFFPFCIEAKSYAHIDFSHLLTPGIKGVEILTFWYQCARDAGMCNKVPILLMRYNSLPKDFHYIVMFKDYYLQLPKDERVNFRVTMDYWNRPDGIKLIIVRSNDFFKMDYKTIKLNAKAYLKKEAQATAKK